MDESQHPPYQWYGYGLSTDEIAAKMAEQVKNPNPPEVKACACCGTAYRKSGDARFSLLTTNGKTRKICGDCVMTMWGARSWAKRNESPVKRRRFSFLRRS